MVLQRANILTFIAVLILAGCDNPTGGGADNPQDQNDDGISVSLGTENVLAAVNGQESDEFGWSVATFADVVVAGAPGVDGVNAVDRGAVYFFERNGAGTWTAMDSKAGDQGADQFGFSSAIDGDYAVVGAPRPDETTGLEYVKIFGRQGDGSWNQIEKPIDETTARDDFGHSVDISGLRVIAGAPKADPPGQSGAITDAGLVYIIDEQGTDPPSWPEGPSHTLQASDPEEQDWFGHAVAIDGDTAVIGAPGAGGEANKAYVFELTGSNTWEEQQFLTPDSPQASGGFGWSVAIAGKFIAVGAPFEDSAWGAVYLYEKEPDGSWHLSDRVVASDRSEDASFGDAVALDGDLLLAGAQYGPDVTFTGRAYLFARNSAGSWREALAFSGSDLAAGDRFGRGVDLSSTSVAVGAPWRDTDTGVSNVGEVSIYAR